MASSLFSGNNSYRLDLITWRTGTTVHGRIQVTATSGTGYYRLSSGPGWALNIGGNGYGGTWTYDFRHPKPHTIVIAERQNDFGGGNILVTATVNMTNGLGSASVSEWVSVPSVPQAPTPIGLDLITPTSMRYRFSGNSDGGSPITAWRANYSTSPVFADGGTIVYSNGTADVSGLTPGTTYYWRAQGANEMGWGPWSTTISATTVVPVPPGLTVTPTPPGTAAVLRLTPPSIVGSVTRYHIEREHLAPPPLQVPALYEAYTTLSEVMWNDLTPGATYRWRAQAEVGSYWTPYSAWQTVVQPQTSTSSGNYFDGSTPDAGDADYSWVGTVNNSASQAAAPTPVGWAAFADGAGGTGAAGAVMRATGGYAGTYAAKAIFFQGSTIPGVRFSTKPDATGRAAVEAGSSYWGSLYVNPSRGQLAAASIFWLNGSGTFLSATTGVATLLGGGVWQRLAVVGIAPVGAVYATIGMIDVSGAGWSAWNGGDTVLLDAAMISLGELYEYFDGNTTDTDSYLYAWSGTANSSTSTRTISGLPPVNPLADPDCVVIPAPPRPPTVPSDCVEDVEVWRRYWAQIPASEVSNWLTMLPTLEITTASLPERQVRIRLYANPFSRGVADLDTSDFCSEQIVSFIPANTRMTLDGVTQRVWAEVNGSPAMNADHLLYGTNGEPAVWPELSCGISYFVSFDVPLDSPAGNINIGVLMTQRN